MNQELPRYIKKKLMRFLLSSLKILPVKHNRVLLINDLAYNYSANPKYVAEYLSKHYPGRFDVYYSVRDPSEYENKVNGIKFIKFNSVKYFWTAMFSKVLLSNSGGYAYLPLRKTQYVINTHHGGGCYKTNGIDMFGDTPLFRKDIMLSSKQTDVFLSTCKRFSDIISRAILLPRDVILEVGMPRNDILINGDDELREKVRSRLGLKIGEKLVLYAPTYRKRSDNYFNESIAISYDIDCKRVCEALERRFGGTWIFGFRLHPCVTNKVGLLGENVMDLSDYPEMQELLLATDVMINDFSSSMWDFMLTGKPCFTYAKDLDHYIATTKLYTPVEDWPFSKAVSNDELVSNIQNFDEKRYKEDCKRHYELLGGCETGRATEIVCDLIYKQCFGDAK